jgi:hypothetical protein
MVLYHRGAAIQASVTRQGNTFVARACILEEDGESTSLAISGNSRIKIPPMSLPCSVRLLLSMAIQCLVVRSQAIQSCKGTIII